MWKRLLALAVSMLLVAFAVPAVAGAQSLRSDTRTADGAFVVVQRDITFENDGGTVVGTMTMPRGARSPVPAVLLLHGFTGTRNELPVLGTDDFMFTRTARVFAENGIASLRIDFRGSGDSDGTFDQTTFTGQITDAFAALDFLDTVRRVDHDRIGVLGFSQGGLVASAVAAADERVASLAYWSPVANPVDTYKGIFGGDVVTAGLKQPVTHIVLPWGAEIDLQQAFFDDLYRVDPIAEVSEYDGPMQVVVGTRDTLVTPQPYYGELFIEYHEGPEELVVVDGDHVFDVLTDAGPAVLDEVIAENLDWFLTTLSG
ncbi:MAG: alpha/beta fold hydrolase [Acidimicrobiia bacterium]|nr:alpha/beta fold hydrolase [Acidimicrobiia bacterium]